MTTVTSVSVEDVGRKRTLYESAGLRELWLVDPHARSVIVLRRSAPGAPAFDDFPEPTGAEQLTSPLLPGFSVEVATLFPA